jgi:hypothetical protein
MRRIIHTVFLDTVCIIFYFGMFHDIFKEFMHFVIMVKCRNGAREVECLTAGTKYLHMYTDKKENQILLIYEEIQIGAVPK